MNIIQCTIKLKEESRNHYRRLAEAVDNADLKRLFTLLADAEAEHVGLLSRMAARLGDAGQLADVKTDWCVFRPAMDAPGLGKALESDPDGYRHVMAEEEETIELLNHFGQETGDRRVKKLCRILANRERKLVDKVENIYSFVEQPRTYLEWGEFSNLRAL